jgi:hypothetical protein
MARGSPAKKRPEYGLNDILSVHASGQVDAPLGLDQSVKPLGIAQVESRRRIALPALKTQQKRLIARTSRLLGRSHFAFILRGHRCLGSLEERRAATASAKKHRSGSQ